MDIMAILHLMAMDLHTDMGTDHLLAMVRDCDMLLAMDLDMALSTGVELLTELLMVTDNQTRVLVITERDPTLSWILREMSKSNAPEISVIWFHGFFFSFFIGK